MMNHFFANPKLSDEEIIRTYAVHNPGYCFEVLYNRYSSKVYKRCYSIVKDADKAQDYTHDIFIRMFAKLDRFESRSSFATWLYSVASNYCLDQIRAGKRFTVSTLDDQLTEGYTVSTEDEEIIEYSLQQLSSVMQEIPVQEAALLRLKYQDGLDIRQIANQLNINDSAVKMRLKRSRERVKRLLHAN